MPFLTLNSKQAPITNQQSLKLKYATSCDTYNENLARLRIPVMLIYCHLIQPELQVDNKSASKHFESNNLFTLDNLHESFRGTKWTILRGGGTGADRRTSPPQ